MIKSNMERSLAKPIPTEAAEQLGLAGEVDLHQLLRIFGHVFYGSLGGTYRHMISRWKRSPRYRNLIKIRGHDVSMKPYSFGDNSLE